MRHVYAPCFMRRKDQGAYTCLMGLETAGHVSPSQARHALAQTFLSHPVMAASLRVSVVSGRPLWIAPLLTEAAAHLVAAIAHRFIDLRGRADAEDSLRASMNDSFAARWNHASGPQIRLDQYALPGGRTMFCLRWLHFLMDAEGAQRLFGEIARLAEESAGSLAGRAQTASNATPNIHRAVDPLLRYSRVTRWRLVGRCFRRLQQGPKLQVRPLHPHVFPRAADHRCLLKSWAPGESQVVRENAKRNTPPGPGLYARHLLACTIRALDRIYARQGVVTDAYLLTMPFHSPRECPAGEGSSSRPIHGNYLVPLTICGRRELVGDRAALGEDILRQYARFTNEQNDILWCAMMWGLGRLRLSMYQALLRLQVGFLPLASGFSYYSEIEPPVRRFLDCRVVNLWGASVVATPPGWNVAFSRFDNRLNLSVTYARPSVPDDLAAQYARWLEEEMFSA